MLQLYQQFSSESVNWWEHDNPFLHNNPVSQIDITPDGYLDSNSFFFLFFLQDSLECDETFVQFVQLNEYLGKSKLLQSVLPFIFFYFITVPYGSGRDRRVPANRTTRNRTRQKGPCFNFFGTLRLGFDFFVSKGSPFQFY